MENYILSINVVYTILLSLTSSDGKALIPKTTECAYKGDMGKIDMENCLARIYEEGHFEYCSSWDILYGKILYDTREDTDFWLNFENKENYAETLTYRITRRKEDGTLESIDRCTSVKLNESCVLPKRMNENEQDYVFIPLADEGDDYCVYPIYERIGYFPWCGGRKRTGCKAITHHGTLCPKYDFVPLSTDSCKTKVDYCFFQLPKTHVVTPGRKHPRHKIGEVNGVKKGHKDGQYRIGDLTYECDLELGTVNKNIIEKLRNIETSDSYGCVFTRTELDHKWDSKPNCMYMFDTFLFNSI